MEEILSWAGDGEDDMAFKYNIIRAFEDERAEGKAEGKAEGIAEGKAEGMTLKLVSLVRKKIHKNKTVEEIAEILEEEPDTITPIYELLLLNPDWDDERICSELAGEGSGKSFWMRK